MAVNKRYVSIAHLVARVLGCPPLAVRGLSAEQANALHVFKYELLLALHRLYMSVPDKRADQVLGRSLKDIAAKLP